MAIINQKDSQIVEFSCELAKAKRESELARVEVQSYRDQLLASQSNSIKQIKQNASQEQSELNLKQQLNNLNVQLQTQTQSLTRAEQQLKLAQQNHARDVAFYQTQLDDSKKTIQQLRLNAKQEKACFDKAQREMQQLKQQHQELTLKQTMGVESNRVAEQMVQKLNQDKRLLSSEIAKLKQEMNTLTLVVSAEPGNAQAIEASKKTAIRQRLLEGEKLIAEMAATKNDTNLLGAKLQEMYVQNEKLAAKLNERNTHLLEVKQIADTRDKTLQDQIREKEALKARYDQERRKNIALSNVLSQRQNAQQESQLHCQRLETSIRELGVFAQVQQKIEESQDPIGSMQRSDESKSLEKTIELDGAKRQIQELTLEKKAMEGELEGCK